MTRDQYITEKILGECWHEQSRINAIPHCPLCGADWIQLQQDYSFNFSSAEGFLKLWNFCRKQEWFEKYTPYGVLLKDCLLYHIAHQHHCDCGSAIELDFDYINPDRFADVVVTVHKELNNASTSN